TPSAGPDSRLPTPSGCLHALRVMGADATLTDSVLTSGAAVIRSLTDNEFAVRVYGHSILSPTRFGLRYRPPAVLFEQRTSADEIHDNQFLAYLAEFGTPLDAATMVDGDTLPLRDVLADTLATFDLEKRELEWTSIALTLYLPPQR